MPLLVLNVERALTASSSSEFNSDPKANLVALPQAADFTSVVLGDSVKWEAWMGLSDPLVEWHLSGKNIRFTTWAWHRSESKYTTSYPQLTQRCIFFFFFFWARTLLQWITTVFLLFHSVSSSYVCISFPYMHTVLSCPSLCPLSLFPFHFPCVSFLYLSCLEQVEHAAGSSLCVGPFRNLMVSAHVCLPGSQRALRDQLSRHLLPHRQKLTSPLFPLQKSFRLF